jgi:hypothetical protein
MTLHRTRPGTRALLSAQMRDAGADREMRARAQEQVSWNQAFGPGGRCQTPSVPGYPAEQQPRHGPASLPEAFQGSHLTRLDWSGQDCLSLECGGGPSVHPATVDQGASRVGWWRAVNIEGSSSDVAAGAAKPRVLGETLDHAVR